MVRRPVPAISNGRVPDGAETRGKKEKTPKIDLPKSECGKDGHQSKALTAATS